MTYLLAAHTNNHRLWKSEYHMYVFVFRCLYLLVIVMDDLIACIFTKITFFKKIHYIYSQNNYLDVKE